MITIFHLKPNMCYIYIIPYKKEINYNCLNQLDPNQDERECQECPPSVSFEEMGDMVDFVHLKPRYATFLESFGKKQLTIALSITLTPIKIINKLNTILKWCL